MNTLDSQIVPEGNKNPIDLEFEIYIGGYGSDQSKNGDSAKTKLVSGNIIQWAQEEQKLGRSNDGFGFGFEPTTTAVINLTDSSDNTKFELELPAGLIALYGPSGVGKTHLLQHILGKIPDPMFVRFNEPELPITHFTPDIVIEEIENFLKSDRRIGGIDSFRFWVYNTLGRSAAGKGGINTGLYSDLTQLSNALAIKGKTLIVIINPMSPDEESKKAVLNALDGSVAGVIDAISYGKFNYKARTKQNNRLQKTYSVDFGEGNKILEKRIKQSPKGRKILVSDDDADLIEEMSINAAKTNTAYDTFSRLFSNHVANKTK